MKRCLTSLIIKEVKIKPQWDFTSYLLEWLLSKKQAILEIIWNKYWQECGDNGKLLCSCLECKLFSASMEKSIEVLQKIKCRTTTIWLGSSTSGYICKGSSVQSLGHVWLFASQWTTARQDSLSIINSQSLLKLMSIASVMPSNLCHLILCHPLLLPSVFPSIRVFSNELVLCIRGQSIGVSASASVLPMNIQDWFPLWLAAWISLQSKGLSRVFSNTTVQKHQFFGAQPSSQSNSHIHTWPLEKP